MPRQMTRARINRYEYVQFCTMSRNSSRARDFKHVLTGGGYLTMLEFHPYSDPGGTVMRGGKGMGLMT